MKYQRVSGDAVEYEVFARKTRVERATSAQKEAPSWKRASMR